MNMNLSHSKSLLFSVRVILVCTSYGYGGILPTPTTPATSIEAPKVCPLQNTKEDFDLAKVIYNIILENYHYYHIKVVLLNFTIYYTKLIS